MEAVKPLQHQPLLEELTVCAGGRSVDTSVVRSLDVS